MPKSLVALALVLLSACAVAPNTDPTPSPTQTATLASVNGYWIGEYVNDETGKMGSITLTLRAWPDSAAGDVVMVPNGSSPFVAADVMTHQHHSAAAEMLHVTFKAVGKGMLEGAVEPYFSTDCSCVVSTVLQGSPVKNRIEGVYVTSNASGLRQQGRWTVDRQVIASN